MTTLSYGKLITQPHDLHNVSLDALVRAIKTRTDLINSQKSLTPFYLPSGTFTQNNLSGCTQHSGLFCIDIDDCTDDSIKNAILDSPLKDNVTLIAHSYTAPNFYILIKTTHESTDPSDHSSAYEHLLTLLPTILQGKADKVTKNINRARFLSNDPNCYYNDNAHPLQLNVKVKRSQSPLQNVGTSNTDYLNLAASWATSKHGEFHPDVKGNRNAWLHHFASAVNCLGIESSALAPYLKSVYPTYDENDFGNLTAINSAYKRVDQFATYILHSDRPLLDRLKTIIDKKIRYVATQEQNKVLYLLDEINLLRDVYEQLKK
jgi:hypothetical protein